MADRRVTATGKDDQGDITKLCRSGADWSPRKKADVISDIEKEHHTYYVKVDDLPRVDVHVVNESGNKYLRTTADKNSKNNLDNLPDC